MIPSHRLEPSRLSLDSPSRKRAEDLESHLSIVDNKKRRKNQTKPKPEARKAKTQTRTASSLLHNTPTPRTKPLPNPKHSSHLESLPQPRSNRPQARVDLSRRGTQDEGNDSVSRDSNVLDGSEDVDLGFGENDSSSGGVLDGESGSTRVSGYTTWAMAQEGGEEREALGFVWVG